MEFEIEEAFPQTAHVILKNAQEKQDFIEMMTEKLGAEKIVAVTTEKEEEEVSTASDAMRVLVSIRKHPKCTVANIHQDTALGLDTINEKLETLLKAGKIKQRMADGVPHYKPAKKTRKK